MILFASISPDPPPQLVGFFVDFFETSDQTYAPSIAYYRCRDFGGLHEADGLLAQASHIETPVSCMASQHAVRSALPMAHYMRDRLHHPYVRSDLF